MVCFSLFTARYKCTASIKPFDLASIVHPEDCLAERHAEGYGLIRHRFLNTDINGFIRSHIPTYTPSSSSTLLEIAWSTSSGVLITHKLNKLFFTPPGHGAYIYYKNVNSSSLLHPLPFKLRKVNSFAVYISLLYIISLDHKDTV